MVELTIDQALQQAIEAHEAGQIKEADRLYTAILEAQPKHPDANHNMGVLAVSVGKIQEALEFFETALAVNPTTAQFWLSYIDALIKLARTAEARAVLEQAKSRGAKGNGFDKLEQRLNEVRKELPEASKIDAEAPLPLPNILDKLKLDQAITLAKKKAKKDDPEEAKRIYQDILLKFPKNKRAADGLKRLVGRPVGKISKFQDPPQDQLQALINLFSQGRNEQAFKQVETLVEQFPKSAVLLNMQGALLKSRGQLDQSLESYNKALAIWPDYPDAYNNIGNTLQSQGKLEEAIEAYNKAIAIKPDFARAYYNMGIACKEQGRLREAIEAYKKALAIQPNYADAYNNMGIVRKEQGKLEEAIEAYNKALAIKPDYTEASYNMGNALIAVIFTQPNSDLQKTITSLLDKKSLFRPRDIARAAISLLKFEPKFKRHLKQYLVGEVEAELHKIITDLSELPLLLKLMSVCPLPDLNLENLLREIRASILISVLESPSLNRWLEFQSALALHCFTNEYIFNQSERENEALAALEVTVKQSLGNGDQPSSQLILCLASYKPLNQYAWSGSLLRTDEIGEVFKRQVLEPKQEAQLKTALPVLGKITGEVSSRVRDQYEVSPYPRWVNLGLRLKATPISDVVEEIKLKLSDYSINEIQSPNILIAGCGTGQHSIETAARFKGSKVLAIDLSLSSLSYAKRKSEELGIRNIDYMQGDILDLGKLDRQFDIVESVGVLHHMDDPVAGWRSLTDCLKPGGLMKIGLYSELARQHIVGIRDEIRKAGIGSSDSAIKSFRTMVMKSDQKNHKEMLYFSDFYSLSELKDLLFHVKEHRFTIPQIQDCLSELGLNFCGFETDEIVSDFKLSNTDTEDPYNLDKWHAYEETNPESFRAMYQFWSQKIV